MRTRDRLDARVVVVGAGFAGASTAAALARRGAGSVTVLEGEAIPGRHASGRNAAIARRVIPDPSMARLAVESTAGIAHLEQRRGLSLLHRTGGLLVGDEADVRRLHEQAAAVPALDAELQRVEMAEARRRAPLLEGATAEAALWTPGCSIGDIHALLETYLAEAREGGARFRPNAPVGGIRVEHGRVVGVETPEGLVACDHVVDAAGFAANRIAAMAGAATQPFRPVRRHLFVTAPWPEVVDPSQPFVWDTTRPLYVRPEGRALLMCACDATPWPRPDAPDGADAGASSPPPTDPAERERLAEVFATHVPSLRDARPAHAWAGLRILTPDGRFVLGPDPALEGFHWAAGLGGHGMTTSHAVGELVAVGLLTGRLPRPWDALFAPNRWRDETG